MSVKADLPESKKNSSILKKKLVKPLVSSEQPTGEVSNQIQTLEYPNRMGSAQGLVTLSKAPKKVATTQGGSSKKITSLRRVVVHPAPPQLHNSTLVNMGSHQEIPNSALQVNQHRSARMIPFKLTDSPVMGHIPFKPMKQYRQIESSGGSQQMKQLKLISKSKPRAGSKPHMLQPNSRSKDPQAKGSGDHTGRSPYKQQYHDEMTHRHKWELLLKPLGAKSFAGEMGEVSPLRSRRTRAQSSSFIRINTLSTGVQGSATWFINPEGEFKIGWEAFKLVLISYTFFYIPFTTAFFEEMPITFAYLNKVLDLFFFVDILLVFLTPVYQNHELVFDFKSISKHYFGGWFWPDILALLPLEEIVGYLNSPEQGFQLGLSHNRKIRLFRLVKLLRLVKAFNFTDQDNALLKFINFFLKESLMGLLLPNILIMMSFLHFFSCLWYIVGNLEGDSTENWIFANGFQNKSELDAYLISFFLMVTSFTSCGYGDIIGNTNAEILVKILVIVSGSLLYGIFLGRISDHRSELMLCQQMKAHKLSKLAEIDKAYPLDPQFHLSLQESIQKIRNDKLVAVKKPALDFSALSREEYEDFEVLRFIHKFADVPLVAGAQMPEHKKWVLEIGKLLEKKEYQADDVIYNKGDPATYLYILLQGAVTFMMTGIELVPILRITKGYFGEREIMLQTTRNHTVTAESSKVVLYRLSRSDFKRVFLAGEVSTSASPPSKKVLGFNPINMQSMRSLRLSSRSLIPKARALDTKTLGLQRVSGNNKAISKVAAKLQSVPTLQSKKTQNLIEPSFNCLSDAELHVEKEIRGENQKFIKDLWTISNKRHTELHHLQGEFEFFLRRKMFWKLVLKNKKRKPKSLSKIIKGSDKTETLGRSNSISTKN